MLTEFCEVESDEHNPVDSLLMDLLRASLERKSFGTQESRWAGLEQGPPSKKRAFPNEEREFQTEQAASSLHNEEPSKSVSVAKGFSRVNEFDVIYQYEPIRRLEIASAPPPKVYCPFRWRQLCRMYILEQRKRVMIRSFAWH